MNTFFSKLHRHKQQQLPFVLFLNPGDETVKAYLQNDNTLNLNSNFNKSGFVFAPFDIDTKESVWFYDDECQILETDTSEFEFISNRPVFRENELYQQLFHQKNVSKAIQEIENGDLYKVIISRKEIQQLGHIDIFQVFQNICLTYPKTFCYCWFHPKIGLWMGASPETLIHITEGSFETMALAGTQQYEGTSDVSWGKKEKEEQQFVVDAIRKALVNNDCVDSIKIEDTITQKAGNLLHLKTPIKAKIKSETLLKPLIQVLHPTPAVCGLPYNVSKKFISNNEGYDRLYYTGFLGEVKSIEEVNLFVNLRCMEVFENISKVAIYVGGGITEASNAEAEWCETVNKSQVMKRIL